MKVRATKLGYYDHKRVREGQVFELKTVQGYRKDTTGKLHKIVIKPEDQFSEKWMERIEAAKQDAEADFAVKKRGKKIEVESEPTTDDDVI